MYRYIIFNKPYGVLSQFTQEHPGQHTLAEFQLPKAVNVSGRLDADSEGLLLLTDDGPLIKALLDPKQAHPRVYLAQVEGAPTGEALTKLAKGVKISDYLTRPAKVKLIEEPELPPRNPPIRYRKNIPTSWIELTLIEGKNRQVRRMTAAVGYPTLRLVRAAIGPLRLDGLPVGSWRELTAQEQKSLIAEVSISIRKSR